MLQLQSIIFLVFISILLPKEKKAFYFSNYMLFGYDSNVSKFSETEDFNFNDSPYITFKPSIVKSFKIFKIKNKKRTTKVSFSTKMNYYFNVEEKSNIGYYMNISQSIGNYQLVKFSHVYIKDIYIREYIDSDKIISTVLYKGDDCYFDLIKFKLSYESPYFGDKEKIEFSIYNELQYYSPEFTEYDFNIKGIEGKYYTKRSDNRYSAQLGYAQADSLYSHPQHFLTEDANGNSLRLVDRSYEEVSLKITYDMPFIDNNVLGFSFSRKNRKYLSNNDFEVGENIVVDQLHKDREHRDFMLSTWYVFNNNNRKNKILFSYREKITTSPYLWVKELKSFSKFEFKYFVYFNKKKLG